MPAILNEHLVGVHVVVRARRSTRPGSLPSDSPPPRPRSADSCHPRGPPAGMYLLGDDAAHDVVHELVAGGRGGRGAMRIQQSPYWPRPPLCFLCFALALRLALDGLAVGPRRGPGRSSAVHAELSARARCRMVSKWRLGPCRGSGSGPARSCYSKWKVGSSLVQLVEPRRQLVLPRRAA